MMWNSGTLVPVRSWGMPRVAGALVPTSSNCLTPAFTLPFWSHLWIALPEFRREREVQHHAATTGLPETPFKTCPAWGQSCAACGPALKKSCLRAVCCRLRGRRARWGDIVGTASRPPVSDEGCASGFSPEVGRLCGSAREKGPHDLFAILAKWLLLM